VPQGPAVGPFGQAAKKEVFNKAYQLIKLSLSAVVTAGKL
jgi:hypothetical protein